MPHRPTASPDVTSALVLLVAAAAMVGCKSAEDRTTRGTIRVGAVVASDFEAEISSIGYAGDVDVDYTSFDVGGGVTHFESTESGEERKASRLEISIAASEFEDDFGDALDALEFAGGGRWFFGSGVVQPFLSAHLVWTTLDDVLGVDLGSQLGVRGGGGVEVALGENFFADIAVDYTVPLLAAESDTTPSIDIEATGVAVRIGVGLIF